MPIRAIGSVGTATIRGVAHQTIAMPDGKEWLSENLKIMTLGPENSPIGEWFGSADNDDGRGRFYRLFTDCYRLNLPDVNLDGWRVPSLVEWQTMLSVCGATSSSVKLLSEEFGGTDDYGFSVRLVGANNYGSGGAGLYCYFMAPELVPSPITSQMSVTAMDSTGVSAGYPGEPGWGVCVRLIRDLPSPTIDIDPFPFSPDWSRPVRERVEYKTAILTSRNGTEQRARLRKIPRRGLEFDVSLPYGRKLDAFLWKSQGDKFGAPWWPDAVRYSGTLAVGTTSISCDCANRLFSLATMIMVWSSPDQCELQLISSVTDDAISCSALAGGYTNPTIIPVFVGRIDASQDLSRVTSRFTQGRVRFLCEVGASDPVPSVPSYSPAYGYYVLDVRPDWQGPQQNVRRILSRFDAGIGPVTISDVGNLSFQSQGFQWFLHGREQVQQFRSFVDLVGGAQVPFWVPTWRQDLVLSQEAADDASAITIQWIGYSDRMFPDRARRYLAIKSPSGGWIYRKATSVSVSGSEETITLDDDNGIVLPAGTPVSFLTLCRLADDDAEIEWSTTEFGQATSRFIELPREVPA